jgi:hypothetical protein
MCVCVRMYTYTVFVCMCTYTWSEVVVQAEDGVSHTGQVNAKRSACLSSDVNDSWRASALSSASSCANAPLRYAHVNRPPLLYTIHKSLFWR